MTKKDLLNSEVFKALPMNAEIVFATDAMINNCVPLNPLNLSAVMETTGHVALVIDAIPYWYLEEKFCITLAKKE